MVAALTVSSALADKITFSDVPPDWQGGPFKAQFVTDGGAAIGPSFLTFCLERSESLSFGVRYDYTIDAGAKQGGGGAVGGVDPISIGTAWLYTQFVSVPGFATTELQLKDLQRTIWYLEGEGNEGGYNYLVSGMYSSAYTALNPLGFPDITVDNDGYFNVWAINPTQNGEVRQSVLKTPDGGLTLVLLGIGMCVLGFLGRRFS